MKEFNGIEFNPSHPEQLEGEIFTEKEFDELEEMIEPGEKIRFGKRGWDAPPGKVKFWVEEDEEEED